MDGRSVSQYHDILSVIVYSALLKYLLYMCSERMYTGHQFIYMTFLANNPYEYLLYKLLAVYPVSFIYKHYLKHMFKNAFIGNVSINIIRGSDTLV